jgi:ketosteroid isomerase-like protein
MASRDLLRAYADAWLAGDLETVLGLYADDFVLHYFGTSPLAGTHTGKEAALAALAAATTRSDRELLAIDDVMGGDSLGAIVAHERLGQGDEAREARRLLLYRTDDSHLLECWLYDEDQRFVDALWSREG